MYAPAPPRPKKTNITRSRKACQACRTKRIRCDGEKPRCSHCHRLDIDCQPHVKPLEFRQVDFEKPKTHGGVWREGKERKRKSEETPVTQEAVVPKSIPMEDLERTPRVASQAAAQQRSAYSFTSKGSIDWGSWITSSYEASQSVIVPQVQQDRLKMILPETNEFSQPGDGTDLAWEQSYDKICDMDREFCLENPGVVSWSAVLPETRRELMVPSHPKFAWASNHQKIFYMNVWDSSCMFALHPTFRQFGILDGNPSIVQDAILSLAACHISRMMPQRRALLSSDVPGLAYKPEYHHQAASQEYYQSATKQLKAWASGRPMEELNNMLAAMILFCSLESSMGNFDGFSVHSNGVRTLLRMRDNPEGPHDSTQLELQDAWRQTVILNWWRRFHFSTPEFQSTPFPRLDEIEEPRERDALFWPIYHRVDIMTTLCESLSLASRATIRGWNQNSKSDMWRTADLENEAQILDDKSSTWRKAVQSSHMSILDPEEEGAAFPSEDYHNMRPMKFSSHEAAMNMAYWAAGSVMRYAAKRAISHITGQQGHTDWQRALEGRFSVLIRIARGISWENCVRYNTYSIGMSGLLLACATRSTKLEAGLWVEDWLEERRRSVGLEEGSFPVLQILQIIRIVNRERRRGFDVCAVFSTMDDGGGKGKFQSYHSQVIESVVVYERCRDTGQEIRKEIAV